jgi:predicted ABC-type transport system involved in lysophospholipase L1 biosynthesis ATPase subunit
MGARRGTSRAARIVERAARTFKRAARTSTVRVGAMTPTQPVVVALREVEKDYKSLRPLRVQHLELRQGESVALLGFDATAAEILVNLITGATLPDAGDVDVFGVSTRLIADPDAWLVEMDRFGILSQRVVLLDAFTVEQNLALPFTLEIEELSDTVLATVRVLAAEVGLLPQLSQRPPSLDAEAQLRLRLGKALALGPRVLLAEHPNAMLPADAVSRFGAALAAVVATRKLSMLVMTADSAFARAVSTRALTLNAATGELKRASGWRKWF